MGRVITRGTTQIAQLRLSQSSNKLLTLTQSYAVSYFYFRAVLRSDPLSPSPQPLTNRLLSERNNALTPLLQRITIIIAPLIFIVKQENKYYIFLSLRSRENV
jgi:hypothetical protein